MSGENDQTKTEQTEELENEDQNQQQTQEDSRDKEATAKAVKSSKDFDELIDKEGVDETPSDESVSTEEDDKNKQKPEPKEAKAEADDKDSGKKAGDTGEQTQEVTYKVSEEIAKKAIDLGLKEEEIADFDSDEELQKTLTIIEDIGKEPDEQTTQQTATKPDEKKTETDSVLKFENEEDIDPDLLKAMKNMEKHYQNEISELKNTVNAMQQNNRKTQQDQFVKRFDSMIDKLGLDFADVFGKGSTNDLSKRSVAYKNRDAIRARMYAFGKGFVEAGQSVPDEQKLFDLAVHFMHGKKIEDVKNAAKSTKAKTYAKSARVGRPASKSAANLTPHQQAVKTSTDFDALIDTSED